MYDTVREIFAYRELRYDTIPGVRKMQSKKWSNALDPFLQLELGLGVHQILAKAVG